MNEYINEIKSYEMLNDIAEENGVVFFGSSFAKSIPVSELSQAFSLNCSVYNRSFTDLSVSDALEVCKMSVLPLNPKKVLIQLGETDLLRGYKSIDSIVEDYNKLIGMLRENNKKINIVIVSVCSNDTDATELNRCLEALAKSTKCQYADITPASKNEKPALKAFSMLKFFIRDRFTFYDAMNCC